jgi:hypothetical protein
VRFFCQLCWGVRPVGKTRVGVQVNHRTSVSSAQSCP